MASKESERWAIVLAGGDGTRVEGITRSESGAPVPKQYWHENGRPSMLRVTLDRARRCVDHRRIVVVVTEPHRPFWEAELTGFPADNVVVQPANRGTAPGIMLPLLHIMARGSDATLLVLPSDHHMDSEQIFASCATRALDWACEEKAHVVVLGMTPNGAASDYGWIVPSRSIGGDIRAVAAFLEKPDPLASRRLYESHALWSSFILAGNLGAFLQLYARTASWLLRSFVAAAQDVQAGEAAAIARLYEAIPPCDFSHHVMERATGALAVLPVPRCGFIDLGTPERLRRHLDRQRDRGSLARPHSHRPRHHPSPMAARGD